MISISTKSNPSTVLLLLLCEFVYHSLGFHLSVYLDSFEDTFLKHALQLHESETGILNKDAERLGRLKPEEKVAIAIDMTDACLQICAAGIRAQNPGIGEEELIEKLRERLEWIKRKQKREG